MFRSWLCISICLFGYTSAEKIIIIGAGASGIATAATLLEHNITDFIVLEAENRIGGRIDSFHLGNATIDLGAQFVHGEKGNVVFDLAKDYVVHRPEINNFTIYFSGKRKIGENLQSVSKELYYDLIQHVYDKDSSLGDVYLSRYNSTVLAKYQNDTEMLNYAKCSLKNVQGAILSLEGAFDWYDISATSTFYDAEGDPNLSWNGLGYKTILDILLKNFPNKTGYNIDNKIFLNRTVSKVILNGNSVNVKCEDGTEYTSDHVVYTPSLGVLKHNYKSLFEPKLSDDKVSAIESLGFDGVMKILIEFPRAWWHENENFLFVWSEKDVEDLKKDIRYGPMTDKDHWLSWFSYMGLAPKNPLVMIGWYSGPFVKEVEKLSKKEMEYAVFYALQKHLSRDYNITKPKTVIHSKWCTNPHFRGTYSYETVTLRKRNITSAHEALLQPVRGLDRIPRILFAGEATNPERYGTVDGAVESGFREGGRLVKILK